MTVAEAAPRLGADLRRGLGTAEAADRLAKHGENRLAEAPPRSKWRAFLDQFRNLLIVVLLGAAVLAGAIGDTKDAVVILVVVLFNAFLGFWQEHRAEQTLAALKRMLAPMARVRRDGTVEVIAATQLVPGDIVLLKAGDRVPADGRLTVTHNVEIDEASLTGESMPARKSAAAALATTAPLIDHANMAYMNTVVTRGRAELLVTETAMSTEMGRLSRMLSEGEAGLTPLQRQLDGLGRRLTLIAGTVIVVIFTLGLMRGDPLVQTILTSVALAVAAIPEGLPAVVTVTLALGMRRMAQHRAIVKRLAAVETLGCTSVICSDKTGTLTLNQMTVGALVHGGRRYAVSGEGYDTAGAIVAEDGGTLADPHAVLLPAALANDSQLRHGQLIGDPTEGALLVLAAKGGIDIGRLAEDYPRIGEVPFDAANRFQASFHRDGDAVRMFVKGAPDALLGRSARHFTVAGVTPLDDDAMAYWSAENARLAGDAMRVLALAAKTIPADGFAAEADLAAHVRDLDFIGLAGITDPPRPEARQAIALCRRAGIRVMMITGDHAATAAAVARCLDLDDQVLDGRALEALTADELAEAVERYTVFARVAPEHKLRIVQALRAGGHIIAVTGDGVNDAPALKNADIGVAMGITGTEVAKEAATMVLTDDNFATIVRAIREGRAIYDNIVKFVRFQLSTNMGAIQTVLGASLLGWPTPFTAIQILWINIIMDGPPAMSLGVEPPRSGVMDERPRATDTRILTGPRLLRLFVYGLTMAVGTLALYAHARPRGEEHALTLAFTTFVLFQFFNLFNARAEAGTAFNRQFFANPWLWLALAAVLALQALIVHWPPAQGVFRTTDLSATDWGLAFAVASSVLLFDELRKLVFALWRRRGSR